MSDLSPLVSNPAFPQALQTAQAYHDAWTTGDLDAAMALIADEIVSDAPGGPIQGITAYRAFIAGFAQKLTGVQMISAFGNANTAVLMYYPQTAGVVDAPAAEWFSVENGRIVRIVLVFDRLAFAAPA